MKPEEIKKNIITALKEKLPHYQIKLDEKADKNLKKCYRTSHNLTGDDNSPYQSARYWHSKINKKESPVFAVYNQLYEDQLNIEGVRIHFDIWVKQLEELLSAHNTIKIGFLQSEFSDPRDASKKPTFSWIYVFEQDNTFTSDDIVYNLSQEIKKLKKALSEKSQDVASAVGTSYQLQVQKLEKENKELKKFKEESEKWKKTASNWFEGYEKTKTENEELKKTLNAYLKLEKSSEELAKENERLQDELAGLQAHLKKDLLQRHPQKKDSQASPEPILKIEKENKELKKQLEEYLNLKKAFDTLRQEYEQLKDENPKIRQALVEERFKTIFKPQKLMTKEPVKQLYGGLTKEELIETVKSYIKETHKGAQHVYRWKLTLDVLYGREKIDIIKDIAKENVSKGWTRWKPILEYIKSKQGV